MANEIEKRICKQALTIETSKINNKGVIDRIRYMNELKGINADLDINFRNQDLPKGLDERGELIGNLLRYLSEGIIKGYKTAGDECNGK